MDELKMKAFGIDDDLGVDLSSDDTLAYFKDQNPGIEALRDFLDSLDVEMLKRLQALMYSGRPNEPDAKFLKQRLGTEAKEDIVRTMMEKRPSLPTYFWKALDRARREGLDIEKF
jgi:hypothetical protein